MYIGKDVGMPRTVVDGEAFDTFLKLHKRKEVKLAHAHKLENLHTRSKPEARKSGAILGKRYMKAAH